jgi:cell division protein FtsX
VVEDLKGDLEAIGVKVEKITREQALATFESMRPDFQSFRMKYGLENPLPASLYVTNVEVRQFPLLKEVMEKASYREVINVDINESTFRAQEERISKWRGIIVFVERLLYAMRFAFLLVAVLIIVSTIRIILLSRQKEIEIMELVGASYTFIRAPFILEGMLYSFVAVLFGLFFYNSFLGELAAQMGRAHMDQFLLSQLIAVQSYFASHALWIFFEQAVLFLCVGALSSFVALSKGFSRKGLSARLPWSSPSVS